MKNRILLLVTLVAAFAFAGNIQKGLFTDLRDGKTYKTVKIGYQVWMAENLNYETDSSCCYEDKKFFCHKFGRLYSWNAAMQACPAGWHLPSDNEWKTLFEAVGGEYRETESDDMTIRIYTTAGKKLKSKSGWDDDNGTDEYGFSVLPAGHRNGGGNYFRYGDYDRAGKDASFWSSTEPNSDYAYSWFFYCDDEGVCSNYYLKDDGFSVRCLRDSD